TPAFRQFCAGGAAEKRRRAIGGGRTGNAAFGVDVGADCCHRRVRRAPGHRNLSPLAFCAHEPSSEPHAGTDLRICQPWREQAGAGGGERQQAAVPGVTLCAATGAVVAIASNDGGKQALEAMKKHLQELRAAPYGLTTEQVVAIASNDGGKQALEAMKKHLQELRADPYGLTTGQVVAIASNNGGKQALEAM